MRSDYDNIKQEIENNDVVQCCDRTIKDCHEVENEKSDNPEIKNGKEKTNEV